MLYEQVRDMIRQYHMIEQGDRIVLGLSGGSDSVCLFHVLLRLKKEMDFQMIAIHVHHGLRGEEADRDQHFVERLCREEGVPLRLYHTDAKALAREWKMTVEEAGRTYRYQVFYQTAAEGGNGKIATAHHANDQAETMLFHLCRGSGLRGLGGMAPVTETREGILIRPLLSVTKEMVWNYLKKNKLEYCMDSTNGDIHFSRNKIRRQLLPLLQEINPEAVGHMSHTAELLRECDAFVRSKVGEMLQKEISVRELRQQPVFLQKEVIREAIIRAAGRARDISAVHIEQVLKLCQGGSGRRVELPYNLLAVREYDALSFMSREEYDREEERKQKEALWEGIPITGEGRYVLPRGQGTVKVSIYPYRGQDFSRNEYTKTLDYDKIKEKLLIRKPGPGDRIVINDRGDSKKLSRYFIDEKVGRARREACLLIAEGQNIVWIIGGRIANTYKISKHTRQVIEIVYEGEEQNGKGSSNDSGGGSRSQDQ